MELTLKEYQERAVRTSLRQLGQARDMYHRYGALSQFSLAATTGAGKTVMAAAIIESLFFGSEEFDLPADPGAVILWFSDNPDLNVQSMERIRHASSELDGRLRIIENTFSEKSLRPGQVYFLNAQKLRKGANLVKGAQEDNPDEPRLFRPAPDMAQRSIYDIIRNTVEAEGRTLYFILDEAHRGMKDGDRQSIVQKLINGDSGAPPMPIVFGISATVKRFTDAMAKMTGRTALPPVEVDSALVQDSGLLKDDIVLTIPTEGGEFDTTLLRQAVRKVKKSSDAWAAYAAEQGDSDPVVPLLVVQLDDKPSQDDVLRVLDAVYAEWPDLPYDAVANVFGTFEGRSHPDLVVGQQGIPYIQPQRVQDAKHIRVLLAIEAISTGWDCPRAEVLVSFRKRQEPQYIHQLLGRMMRTPLARRIPGNEVLNSVECLLPYFDRQNSTAIAAMLMKGKTATDDGDETPDPDNKARRVLFDPVVLTRNTEVPDSVWALMETLPSVTIPRKFVKPLKRLSGLSVALSKDGLVEGAVAKANAHLCSVLDGRAVQYADKVAAARQDVLTMTGEEVRGRVGQEGFTYKTVEIAADARAIQEAYDQASRLLSTALASAYVDHIAAADADGDELIEANLRVAALAKVPEIVADVEEEADKLARAWLTETRVARKSLSDERQVEYDRLEGMSTQPERVDLLAPTTGQADRKVREADGSERELPSRRLHLLAAEDGTTPIDVNAWETKVIDSEMAQPGFKGWYRNPARNTKESLAIAYKDDQSEWKALRPDFIFFGTDHLGEPVADLVDPHGHHLADALPKLRGLADFAEKYGWEFRRVESVAETDGKLRVLDLTKHNVRQAVREAVSAKGLYESDLASDY